MEYLHQLFANTALQTDTEGRGVEVFLQHQGHIGHNYKMVGTCFSS
jgi:hypothetical protein